MYSNGSPPHSNVNSKTGGSTTSGRNGKRTKRSAWGARERAGMSFLIVVAFFAVFGLIILTEVLMLDDRGRSSAIVRHSYSSNRLGDAVPDYDDIKDDYGLEDAALLVQNNKFGGSPIKGGLKGMQTSELLSRPNNDLKMSVGIPVQPDQMNPRNGFISIPWGQALPARIEKSLPAYPHNTKPTDGSWQVVNGTRFKFFVFSAFYDRRDGKLIRIIGATKTRGPERVWCRLWHKLGGNGTTNNIQKSKYYSTTVLARVKVIRENWNLKYSACFILCPLRPAGIEIPYAISVVSRLRAPPGNLLQLRNIDADPDFVNRSIKDIPPDKIAICVKPLHFNYDQALYLLEFLELNTLLGVTHFTLYNHTIGPHASCVLKHYIKYGGYTSNSNSNSNNNNNFNNNVTNANSYNNVNINHNSNNNNINKDNNYKDNNVGSTNNNNLGSTNNNNNFNGDIVRPKAFVTLLPWNLKMRSQKEIRTEGLFAALNDCLYRNMYRYPYVALVDLDEFIIPRHNDTLNDLLKWLSLRMNSRNTGAYSFQNAFFYLQFGDDPLLYDFKSKYHRLRSALTTQRKTRRRLKLHPQKQRSKYICKPESVIEAGNHFVWEFIPGRGSLNVPADSAILHHYRVCEFGGDDCIKTPSLIDRTAHKYTNHLLERVSKMYEYLKEPCNLPDIPPAPTRPPHTKAQYIKLKNKKNVTIAKAMGPSQDSLTATNSGHIVPAAVPIAIANG